jgi:hypothetical protein
MSQNGDAYLDGDNDAYDPDAAYERHLETRKAVTIERARTLRAHGASLFEIGRALGVTKEWLRTYAGI